MGYFKLHRESWHISSCSWHLFLFIFIVVGTSGLVNESNRPPASAILVQFSTIRIRMFPCRFDFDPLDVTKTWPENMFPLQPVGRMVGLNSACSADENRFLFSVRPFLVETLRVRSRSLRSNSKYVEDTRTGAQPQPRQLLCGE